MQTIVAVLLKNDSQATEYFTNCFPESEIYYVDEMILSDNKDIDLEYLNISKYLDSLNTDITIACGVGNLRLATFLHKLSQEFRGYFYMTEPTGVIKMV